MKRFNVCIPREDGGIEVYPMKEWLRQHPERVPSGMDANDTNSHQLRSGLRKMKWTVQETETEVRLLPPDAPHSILEVDTVLGSPDQEPEESREQAFALEYQLRDFLAENIQTIRIDGKSLELYVDQTDREGVEYPTAVGAIDILCIDQEGTFYVFELKRGRGSDAAVGQLTRYMGWVSRTIGRGRKVKGVIVARTVDDRLRYSASVVPDLHLFEYRVEFHLEEADTVLD